MSASQSVSVSVTMDVIPHARTPAKAHGHGKKLHEISNLTDKPTKR